MVVLSYLNRIRANVEGDEEHKIETLKKESGQKKTNILSIELNYVQKQTH
jgi:hypothetical protein